MEIPTMLLQRVLLDVGLQLSDTINKDCAVIHSRFQREGMSFLTIALPTLDDALLKGLAQGRLTRDMYTGFRSVSRRRSLPALLQGFFKRIFDDDGFVLAEPDVCAIFAIRQVTRLFKKVELPCSEPRIKAAYERYVSNDGEVDWRRHSSHIDTSLFRSVCGFLWSGLEMLGNELYCSPGIFGPGATSERVNRNERHTIKEWPERAETSFPSSFHASHQEDANSFSGIRYLQVEEERPVRVVQVPKTLKTPRTISVEPSYVMLMQQSVAKPLMLYLESQQFGFQSIRFVDQSINNRLAREGSVDGSLSTIDLKDASDLVDLDLVREIFRGPCPAFLNLILDCRTTKALLPDKTHIPLRKFASMGSALCFPIESMVFFTIIMYALVKQSGRVPSRRLLQALAKNVAVYGDDIIVPSLMAPVVMESLEAFGLKVNRDKSFHTGLFRESCGGDYYKGVDVTPAYVRHWDETGTLSNSSHLVAYVSLSNTFYMKGLWHACSYIREGVVRRTRRNIPLARHPVGVLHFSSYLYDSHVAWDSNRSGYRVKGYRIKVTRQPDSPTNMEGFLSLAFGTRYFRTEMQRLKSRIHTAPRYRLSQEDWLDGSGTAILGCSHFAGSGTRANARDLPRYEAALSAYVQQDVPGNLSRTSSDHTEMAGNPSTRVGSYAWIAAQPGKLSGLNQNPLDRDWHLQHLTPVRGSSLYTSERPHALCLKRGWTASQAGLSW